MQTMRAIGSRWNSQSDDFSVDVSEGNDNDDDNNNNNNNMAYIGSSLFGRLGRNAQRSSANSGTGTSTLSLAGTVNSGTTNSNIIAPASDEEIILHTLSSQTLIHRDASNELLFLDGGVAATIPTPDDYNNPTHAECAESWEPVRTWLTERVEQTDGPASIQRAVQHCDNDTLLTALHYACRNRAPLDIIEIMLEHASHVAEIPDNVGWLPLHYACACGADHKVLKALVDAFPDGRTAVDRRMRTPLYFALTGATGSTDSEDAEADAGGATSTTDRDRFGNKRDRNHYSHNNGRDGGGRDGGSGGHKKNGFKSSLRTTPISKSNTDAIILLSASGAAAMEDDVGMLPLHYACALGASEENLYILTGAHPEGVVTVDKAGRTPLHFALSNADREQMPAVVRHLVTRNAEVVNAPQRGSPHPLRVLAEFTSNLNKPTLEDKEYCAQCMEYVLLANPEPTADFFTGMQFLPHWLSDKAVVMPCVQNILNMKIAERFPSAVLMLDFLLISTTIGSYSYLVDLALKTGVSYQQDHDTIPVHLEGFSRLCWLALYVGAVYFLLRSFIQCVSLISLNSFNVWLNDPNNLVNLLFISVVFWWASQARTFEIVQRVHFEYYLALTVPILWIKILAFLRSMLIEFAVFVGGLYYVLSRLAAFLVSLWIILIAFSLIFSTLYRASETCQFQPANTYSPNYNLELTKCDNSAERVYCNRWSAFLNCVTMLLGELDESPFEDNRVAIFVFCLFEFMVVILLANVLIAIVTDSYKVIQDQRAAVVFWTNRLDFVAEMDAIYNGPWKRRLMELFGYDFDHDHSRRYKKRRSLTEKGVIVVGEEDHIFGEQLWHRMMEMFEESVLDDDALAIDHFMTFFVQLFTALVLIPLWLGLGVITAGLLWPPQVRENVFTSTVFKHASESEKEAELRRTQVTLIAQEVQELRNELVKDLAVYRTQIVQMKSLVSERKTEINNEMKDIKRAITILFEQRAAMDDSYH